MKWQLQKVNSELRRAQLASYSGLPVILGSDNEIGNCKEWKFFDKSRGLNRVEDTCNIKMEVFKSGQWLQENPFAFANNFRWFPTRLVGGRRSLTLIDKFPGYDSYRMS